MATAEQKKICNLLFLSPVWSEGSLCNSTEAQGRRRKKVNVDQSLSCLDHAALNMQVSWSHGNTATITRERRTECCSGSFKTVPFGTRSAPASRKGKPLARKSSNWQPAANNWWATSSCHVQYNAVEKLGQCKLDEMEHCNCEQAVLEFLSVRRNKAEEFEFLCAECGGKICLTTGAAAVKAKTRPRSAIRNLVLVFSRTVTPCKWPRNG